MVVVATFNLFKTVKIETVITLMEIAAMSTIKSSDEHLTLNADGSSKDIKFQANGVEKASISSSWCVYFYYD